MVRKPSDSIRKTLLIVFATAIVGASIFMGVGAAFGAGGDRTWAVLGACTGGAFGYFWWKVRHSG
jgi:hypothetical protein